MSQKMIKVFTGLLVVLLFTNIYTLTKLSLLRNMEGYLFNMDQRLYNQSQELNDLRNEIHKLNEKEKLIGSYDYFIENINNDYEKANVEIEIEFNKLKNNATPYLIYSIQGDEKSSEKIELTNETDLKYKSELLLSYSYNYDMQIIVESDEEQIREELPSVDLLGNFNKRLSLRVWPKEYKENKKIEYEIQVFNELEDDPRLAIEEIKADVYYMDEKIDSIDVVKDGNKIDNDSMYQEWIFEDTINIEDIKDKNVQEKILFKFKVVTSIGKEYNLERRFIEFISN